MGKRATRYARAAARGLTHAHVRHGNVRRAQHRADGGSVRRPLNSSRIAVTPPASSSSSSSSSSPLVDDSDWLADFCSRADSMSSEELLKVLQDGHRRRALLHSTPIVHPEQLKYSIRLDATILLQRSCDFGFFRSTPLARLKLPSIPHRLSRFYLPRKGFKGLPQEENELIENGGHFMLGTYHESPVQEFTLYLLFPYDTDDDPHRSPITKSYTVISPKELAVFRKMILHPAFEQCSLHNRQFIQLNDYSWKFNSESTLPGLLVQEFFQTMGQLLCHSDHRKRLSEAAPEFFGRRWQSPPHILLIRLGENLDISQPELLQAYGHTLDEHFYLSRLDRVLFAIPVDVRYTTEQPQCTLLPMKETHWVRVQELIGIDCFSPMSLVAFVSDMTPIVEITITTLSCPVLSF